MLASELCGMCVSCHLSRRRIRVPRRTLQHHEEFEIQTFRLWTSPNIPRFVHSTCGHDQHLITAISNANECSILPLRIQFRLSCTSKSNRHEVHWFSKFNQLSAVQLTSMQFIRCAPVTTNLIPRPSFPRVFHEKSQDGMSRRYFAFHALTHRHFNGTVRLMLLSASALVSSAPNAARAALCRNWENSSTALHDHFRLLEECCSLASNWATSL